MDIKSIIKQFLINEDEFPSFSADDAFEFLWKTQGKRPPLAWFLKNAPDQIEKEDLYVEKDLNLRGFGLTHLPDGLTVGVNLILTENPIKELPYNMTVRGGLVFDKSDPIPQKYGMSEIELEYASDEEKDVIRKAIMKEADQKDGYVDWVYFRGNNKVYY